jgi:hypothetical protein
MAILYLATSIAKLDFSISSRAPMAAFYMCCFWLCSDFRFPALSHTCPPFHPGCIHFTYNTIYECAFNIYLCTASASDNLQIKKIRTVVALECRYILRIQKGVYQNNALYIYQNSCNFSSYGSTINESDSWRNGSAVRRYSVSVWKMQVTNT